MKLYYIFTEHRYVHRQADVPKGTPHEVRDIPTDLAGLMAKLNDFEADRQLEREHWKAARAEAEQVYDEMPVEDKADTPTFIQQAEQQITVEEAIQTATPHQLAKYAENVCWRIKELAGKL